jgi:ABC-type sugar transport systems, ATPase components
LLDEPLSNLDAKLRVQMRTEIAQLHQRLGRNFIYVTHDQVEAMTMADRIVIMNDGMIQQVGTPSELYSKPANKFVAGFIGSPQLTSLMSNLKMAKLLTMAELILLFLKVNIKYLNKKAMLVRSLHLVFVLKTSTLKKLQFKLSLML